jgi:two-component system chemotaxis sensor kinase CheA
VTIVVVKAGDRPFGLVVDEVHDTEEIVVKPLSAQCASVNVFSGCTIMGDGRVALILDILGLAQRTQVISTTRDQSGAVDATRHIGSEDTTADGTTLLVARVGSNGRVALELDQLDRLEEFSRDIIEYTAGRPVVQYRGEVLPLIDVASACGYVPSAESSSTIQVVVCTHHRQTVGLVVERIVDIVDHHERLAVGDGGAPIVSGAITDLLDLDTLIPNPHPNATYDADVEEAYSNV